MKVSPGVWYLQLAPGRSADLYVLKENGDESSSALLVTINDLRGKVVHLGVAKKRGKEHEELLSTSDDHMEQKRKVFGFLSNHKFLLEPWTLLVFISFVISAG